MLVPNYYLWPIVFVTSVIGSYGPNQSMVEIWIMLVAGVVGYFLRRFGFSPAPLVMGLVLGVMAEETLKQSMIMFDQNWLMFFTRPVVVVLFSILVAVSLAPPIARWLKRYRTNQKLA
jgi:putative tricarboxylic transport membrane protein